MPDTIIYLDRIKSVTSQHNVLDTITYGGIMVASTRENVMTKIETAMEVLKNGGYWRRANIAARLTEEFPR